MAFPSHGNLRGQHRGRRCGPLADCLALSLGDDASIFTTSRPAVVEVSSVSPNGYQGDCMPRAEFNKLCQVADPPEPEPRPPRMFRRSVFLSYVLLPVSSSSSALIAPSRS